MQNRYAGDIGDFAKLGLLRALSAPVAGQRLNLAVIWYLVPDESHNADGKHVAYLAADDRTGLASCDTELHDALKCIVDSDRRTVADIEAAGVLPGARYFGEPLTYTRPFSRRARSEIRSSWLDRAVASCANADIVFLDPDNGLQVRTGPHAEKGPKYVFWSEVERFASEDRSVVIYQHLSRAGKGDRQIATRLDVLKDTLPCVSVWALRFHRLSPRAFLIAARHRHATLLIERSRSFAEQWSPHFTSVGL